MLLTNINNGITHMDSSTKYPTFEIGENAELWQEILPIAIPQIGSKYFQANLRFKIFEKILSKDLIDYMSIYEEGDWWCLTVIKITFNDNQIKYIFLPLSAGAADYESPAKFTLFDNQNPVIGMVTNSTIYGKRSWVLYDAVSDVAFCKKLINLFLPHKNIPENHPNAYTVIQKTGFGGKFDFHLLNENNFKEVNHTKMIIEFTENNDISVKYNNIYQLVLHKYAQPVNNISHLKKEENLIGYITYSNPSLPELLVGILVNL